MYFYTMTCLVFSVCFFPYDILLQKVMGFNLDLDSSVDPP